MPGRVKVRILAGRNLPVMDRANETTDAYVEVKLASTIHKTDVCRRTLSPQWNSEWFKFEVDDSDLQDEPLQIRLMDHDTYSANDAIGKVYIDLNPLLLPSISQDSFLMRDHVGLSSGGLKMAGWIPVYDTMHGIRGEVNIIVKVDLFSDFNKYRTSSCGVQFFSTPGIPHGFKIQAICGFVEELVVNDDPEYQWIDKIRTPRSSNETRQTLFTKLSGEVQRRIGLKALHLGGNAVLGYKLSFDLEGESGIVVRGIGTSVRIGRHQVANTSYCASDAETSHPPSQERKFALVEEDLVPPDGVVIHASPNLNRPTSTSSAKLSCKDSEISLSARRGSHGESGEGGLGMQAHFVYPRPPNIIHQDSFDMLEYPFLTMTHFPPEFIRHLGGIVCARSIKLLDRIHNPEEPETRDSWWTELRMEIRSHAKALGCNGVLGYEETTCIYDDICIVSAMGTAAVLNHTSEEIQDYLTSRGFHGSKSVVSFSSIGKLSTVGSQVPQNCLGVCTPCHIPYSENNLPFPISLQKCMLCKKGKVPDIIFANIEPLHGLPLTGRGTLVQARFTRMLRDCKGEAIAKEISECLPFVEYELHCQLLQKTRVKGMNAIFGLQLRITLGERMIIGISTATAVCLTALPSPPMPIVSQGHGHANSHDPQNIDQINSNKSIPDIPVKGKPTVSLSHQKSKPSLNAISSHLNGDHKDLETDSDEDGGQSNLDLTAGNKDVCILEADDNDTEDISLLKDAKRPPGIDLANTDDIPGLPEACSQKTPESVQLFTQVVRSRISPSFQTKHLSESLDYMTKALSFKFRKSLPCRLTRLHYLIDLPEQDEIQICLMGVGILPRSPKFIPVNRRCSGGLSRHGSDKFGSDDVDRSLQNIDQVSLVESDDLSKQFLDPVCMENCKGPNSVFCQTLEKHGIDITLQSHVPGAKISQYLGYLNFFFIRESTSIRESGGLPMFLQSFISEVMAILRAHVAALGGNAMVSYFMSECVLEHNSNKNQGQCLINVGGDVVRAVYKPPEV